MKKMWKGNHALAEAAVRAGCEFYAGYPITPQTEVMEYLSARMPEMGRTFIQAENEISAINMIFGSYACGMRSMTSSSGPGISLKQEGISYLCANGFPAVIANVQRWGAGLGSLDSSQCDYLRETRGGGNGDYRVIVYIPNTIQEMVDLTYESFDIAEKYRNPVEILSEAALGQMMEPVEFPEHKVRKEDLGWTFDGTNRDHDRVPTPERPKIYRKKYEMIAEQEQRWESSYLEDAEYVFVSIGLASRTTKTAVARLREMGKKVGFIRPISAWPFPYNGFKEVPDTVKGFISVENNDAGQLVEDVALAAKKVMSKNVPIYGLFTGQKIPKTKEIIETYEQVLSGLLKEVF
jgi:2-oxoglutarate ferredoxin oxidoreductase subunit alpha